MNLLKNVGNVFFSAWCWISTYTWMIVTSLVWSPWILMIFGQKRAHRWTMWPCLGWCIPMCFIRTKVTHHPEFDPDQKGVLLQNHVSVLDGSIATYTIPHPFCGLFNSWHFHIPGYGWIMRLSNGIGVPSKKEGRSEILSREVKDRIHTRDISVLAFPEGHRTMDGKVREFRRGVFFMARDAGVPVIPLCVRGIWECQNKTHKRFYPGQIDVYFGKPIPTAGLTDEQIGDLAEHCRLIHQTWVEQGEMPQMEGFPEPPRAQSEAVAA